MKISIDTDRDQVIVDGDVVLSESDLAKAFFIMDNEDTLEENADYLSEYNDLNQDDAWNEAVDRLWDENDESRAEALERAREIFSIYE